MHPTHRTPAFGVLLLSLAVAAGGCNKPGAGSGKKQVKATYDERTGKLAELAVDTNKDGRPDLWGRMDGPRIRVVEVDKDGNGKPDRWEYYLPDGRLEKVGTSEAGSGKPNTFYFQDKAGTLAKIERAAPDGRITKTEFYEGGLLARAEEDSDRDGKVDRWVTYTSGRLASVSFDVDKNGTPTRRLLYEADGTVRLENLGERPAPPVPRK